MNIEISAQHIDVHPRWRRLIERRAAKLANLGAKVLRLHVTLIHSTHHLRGNEEVRLLATLPGQTLRAEKAKSTMADAIHAAFSALEREIQSYREHLRSPEREFGPWYSGVIAEVFPARGYGFIRTPEDQEVYFHREAVHDAAFEDLREGQPVVFLVEQGEKGPQAWRVQPARTS